MKVTFPHMGDVELILTDLLRKLDVDYVAPPPTSNKTIAIGSKLSPELACFPLKVTLGNMVEGLEAGADTIIMAGGFGPCRFGYYAQVQREILKEAGYDFEMIVVEPPTGGLNKFVGAFKKLSPGTNLRQLWRIINTCFHKARVVDILEKRANQLKAYEVKTGSTNNAFKKAIRLVKAAKNNKEISKVSKEAQQMLSEVEVEERAVLKVGLVGEFYLLLDPFINFNIEDYLGKHNVLTERSVYLTDWISPSAKNIVSGHTQSEIEKSAAGYLSHWVGGEGQATVGHSIIFAQKNFDGVIHIFPFTCMPEIVAQSILPKVSHNFGLPYMTLVFDEQTGRSGVITRLEAFLDLLWSKKERKHLYYEARESA